MNQWMSFLPDFLSILFKHKYKILTVFLIVVTTVVVGTFLMQPVYEVDSTLLLKFGREYVYRPEVGDRPSQSAFDRDLEPLMNAEIQILTSRNLVVNVIQKLGVKSLYPNIENRELDKALKIETAASRFQADLSVKGVAQSSTLQISFLHTNPNIAAKALNLLIDTYKDKHLQAFSDPRASSFLQQQVDAYRQRFTDAQKKLEAFKLRHSSFAQDEQRTLLLRQRADLDATYKSSTAEAMELQRKIQSMETQAVAVSAGMPEMSTGGPFRAMDDTRTKLLELQLKEKELAAKFNDGNQALRDVRDEIELVQNVLRQQQQGLHGDSRSEFNQEMAKGLIPLRAELQSVQAKTAVLRTQIQDVDSQLKALSGTESELQNLQLEVDSNQQNYANYQKKLQDALISRDMDRQKFTNISVIQPATPLELPVKPNKLLNILVGMFLGAAAGIGLAFLLESFNRGVNDAKIAEERLGVPVVVTVPFKEATDNYRL